MNTVCKKLIEENICEYHCDQWGREFLQEDPNITNHKEKM